MFLPDDLHIESMIVDNDNLGQTFPRLSNRIHVLKPDAVLTFETIPQRTCITFQKVVYNRFPIERGGTSVGLDDESRILPCTLDADMIIQALAEKEIPAICAQDLRPSDCSYVSSIVPIMIERQKNSPRRPGSIELPDISAHFGLIQLPLLSDEVCRNVHHRHAPSISRQALVDAIHIICQFA